MNEKIPCELLELYDTWRGRWDSDYLTLAQFWAERKSKDPSTKVGSVVVNSDNDIVGMGYNGFPKRTFDLAERYHDRPTKYKFIVHAEMNALRMAGHNAQGGTIYVWPLFTCHECAKMVIQYGIKRVVHVPFRQSVWKTSYDITQTMYRESGVETVCVDLNE